MGATGNVSGPHLHLECSNTQTWNCSTFVNPCNVLGIPNEDNLIINYDGSVTPEPPPTPEPEPPVIFQKDLKGFNWSVYTKKIRNRRKQRK